MSASDYQDNPNDDFTRTCPACGFVANSPAEEIAHMEARHRDIIDERLHAAGMEDYRTGPDLPSYLTLRELGLVHIFAEMYVPEEDFRQIQISILVRDRGPDRPGLKASWIEFSVGERKFAIWRHTMDLYEVGPDGAVGDEPIHRND